MSKRSHRSRQPLSPIPQDKNQPKTILANSRTTEIFSGPIPSPAILQGYAELDHSYPDRILKMAEMHVNADVNRKNKETIAIARGQWFSFVIAIFGILSAIFFVLKGLSGVAISAILGGIAPILIAAIKNLIYSSIQRK